MQQNFVRSLSLAPITVGMVIDACLKEDIYLLKYYNSRVDLNKVFNSEGLPLLHLTIMHDKYKAFNTLLNLGINVETIDDAYGSSPFNFATMVGDSYYVNILLKHNVDVNQRDFYGYTPLANAIFFEHFTLANSLIKLPQVDINIPAFDDMPPLVMAYLSDKPDIFNNIIKHPQFDPTFTELLLKSFIIPGLDEHLYEQRINVNFSLVEAYDQAKIFGLKYDLDTCMNFNNLNLHQMDCFKFEAYFNTLGKVDLAESFLKFYDDVIAPNPLPAVVRDIFINVKDSVLFTATHDTPDAYLNQILANKAVLLPSGWEGHSVAIVIYKEKLYLCNRGDLSDGIHGITEFNITKYDHLTAPLIMKILDGQGSPDFLQKELIDILGLEKIGEIENPTQIAGNCVWTSLETGVEAVFLANFIDQGFGSEEAHQLSKESFSIWEEYDLNASLKVIIDNEPTLAQHGLYGNLLIDAFESHHDSSNIFDLQKGIVILEELSKPEYYHEFYNQIGQYVLKYDPVSYYEISYMKNYTSYANYIYNNYISNYLSQDDKVKAQEYYEFLKACDQYQNNIGHSVINVNDVLNMGIDDSLGKLIDHAFYQEPSAQIRANANPIQNAHFTETSHFELNPHLIKPELVIQSIESFA